METEEKNINCNNLIELFAEFKKFRDSKKEIAKEENFRDYVNGFSYSMKIKEDPKLGTIATTLIENLSLDLKEQCLSLYLPTINLEAYI